MSYMKTINADTGYSSSYLDVQAIARDLAPLVGGEWDDDKGEGGSYGRGFITMPGGWHLTVCSKGNDTIALSGWHGRWIADRVPLRQRPQMPQGNFSMSKGLERIAREAEKRILAPAREAHEHAKALADAVAGERDRLVATARDWQERFPHLEISVPSAADAYEASVHASSSRTGVHMTGKLSADGSLYVERITRLDPVRAAALADLLSLNP